MSYGWVFKKDEGYIPYILQVLCTGQYIMHHIARIENNDTHQTISLQRESMGGMNKVELMLTKDAKVYRFAIICEKRINQDG